MARLKTKKYPAALKIKVDTRGLGAKLKAAAKRKVTYIAVIARLGMNPGFAYTYSSNRYDGGWYALMGTDKAAIIHEALTKVQEFGAEKYEVWVGTLTEKVLLPIHFEVVKL